VEAAWEVPDSFPCPSPLLPWDNPDAGHYHAFVRACSSAGQSASLTTTDRAHIPSSGDQQEQPFVQVSAKYIVSSE
jgi:hypothetical protein